MRKFVQCRSIKCQNEKNRKAPSFSMKWTGTSFSTQHLEGVTKDLYKYTLQNQSILGIEMRLKGVSSYSSFASTI